MPPKISVIIPTFNSAATIGACLKSLLSATQSSESEIIVVDNGSQDETIEFVNAVSSDIRVFQYPDITVGALRNRGVVASTGTYLAFLDSDFTVSKEYFVEILNTFNMVQCAASGSMAKIPAEPGWIESVWDDLHRRKTDGFVNYLNSGNLIIERRFFKQVEGFSETLVSGEDTDLCQRLIGAGHKIFERHAIVGIHHGNPKSIRQFFRRQLWHGSNPSERGRMDKIEALALIHGLTVLASLPIIVLAIVFGKPLWSLFAISIQMLAPLLAVLYRALVVRRWIRVFESLLLYYVYLNARAIALLFPIRRK
jgi:glycosyltransferase involved in cell wall biosynthesis